MIIIFGASILGEIAYYVLRDKYEIIGFSDNDTLKHGKMMCGLPIYSPNEIVKFKDTDIVIASRHHMNIGKQLKELGFVNVKVFLYEGEAALAEEYHSGYKLIKYDMSDFYKNAKAEKERIELIQKDFRLNYENADVIKKSNINNKINGKKKVLFCAYFFPPLGLGGTQRSLKFVKYLRMFGYEPVVVTVGNDAEHYKRDNSMLNELPSDIEILRFDNEFESVIDLGEAIQQQILNLYAGIGVSDEWIEQYLDIVRGQDVDYQREVLIPDNNIYWVNNVLKNIEEKIDMSEIDLVFTTVCPFSSEFIGYYIKQKYNIPWIIDYRDPWTTNDIQVKYRHKYSDRIASLLRQVEKIFAENSDHIITVTEGILEEIEEKIEINRAKMSVITNGFDEEDFYQIDKEESERFTLCYNGQIYNKDDRFNEENNYTIVLKAVNLLIDEGKVDKNDIQWVLAGSIDESVKAKLKEIDKYNLVYFNGYLEHKESLRRAINSNMLVHLGFYFEKGKGGFGGAKVFEYIRMKTPIIFLSKPGGALDKLVEELGYSKNFDYKDLTGISQYILNEYINWKQGNNRIILDEAKIFKYERKNLTKHLAEIFDKLIGEN